MGYLAVIAVDKRQNYIKSADKLQEMLGASWLIESTVECAEELSRQYPQVTVVRPVSGETWVRAESLADLQPFLWEMRKDLVQTKRLSVTFAVVPEKPSPKATYQELEGELQRQKSGRSGSDGAPASPYFARCRIQPELPPNIWRLGEEEKRRQLVSHSADLRRDKATSLWTDIKQVAGALHPYEQPRQMSDFTAREGDSYVALVKADVDRLGPVQMNAKWDTLGGHKMIEKFSRTIRDAVRKAVGAAIEHCLGPAGVQGEYAPVLPVVMAGDDLWVICRREQALRFAVQCGRVFAEECAQNEDVRSVCAGETLTISFGVLLAKQGFPMDQQLELAEELMGNAKKLRKSPGRAPEGCLDFFWLASSGRETVQAARRAGGGYELESLKGKERELYQLTTRPWSLTEADAFLVAAERFRQLPATKRHQLPQILRFGGEFTDLALRQWWQRLRAGEKDDFQAALEGLPDPFKLKPGPHKEGGGLPMEPWLDGDVHKTPLLDLAEVAEILDTGKRGGPQ